MRWTSLFFSLHGRISRRTFWIGATIASVLLVVIDVAIAQHLGAPTSFALSAAVLAAYPLFAVCVKRLHDLNRSGWWMMVIVAPVIAALALGYGARLFGASNALIYAVTIGVLGGGLAILAVGAIAVLGLRPGGRRYNAFGGPPLY